MIFKLGWKKSILSIGNAEGHLDPLPWLQSIGMINNYMMLLLPHKSWSGASRILIQGADLGASFDSAPLHQPSGEKFPLIDSLLV